MDELTDRQSLSILLKIKVDGCFSKKERKKGDYAAAAAAEERIVTHVYIYICIYRDKCVYILYIQCRCVQVITAVTFPV